MDKGGDGAKKRGEEEGRRLQEGGNTGRVEKKEWEEKEEVSNTS